MDKTRTILKALGHEITRILQRKKGTQIIKNIRLQRTLLNFRIMKLIRIAISRKSAVVKKKVAFVIMKRVQKSLFLWSQSI